MGAEWGTRWTGAACAVVGCGPLLLTALAGAAGAAGAQAAGVMGRGMGMAAAGTWSMLLQDLSWPLLAVSVVLLLWSFRRAQLPARLAAYAGVAVLVINRLHMTLWFFLPALALVALGFVLDWSAARAGAPSSRG